MGRRKTAAAGRTVRLLGLPTLAALTAADTALAHVGSGGAEATEFVMPRWVVYIAGAFVIALSFALIGAFLSREHDQTTLYRANGTPPISPRPPQENPRITPLQGVGLLVLALVIAHAWVPGDDGALPGVVLWLGVWVILPLVAYTLGDPWPRLSPFTPLLPLARLLRGGRTPRAYPAWLGLWPAVALLLALVGLEVTDAAWAQGPSHLGAFVAAYALLTFTGTVIYGRGWLDHAEVVARMLAWWSAVSPIRWEHQRPRWRGLQGFHQLNVHRLDGVAFTIGVLYGVNHDVFLHSVYGQGALTRLTSWSVPAPQVVLLAIGYLVFLLVWILAARAMRERAETLHSIRGTAAVFVASLLPIAAAYHLAHNLPYLFQNGAGILAATGDPLGLGWAPFPLFGRTFPFPPNLLGALAGTQVLLVILGHLLAVLVAHRLAFSHHPSRVQAVRAEIPLTLVMVVYTGIGLALLGAEGGVA